MTQIRFVALASVFAAGFGLVTTAAHAQEAAPGTPPAAKGGKHKGGAKHEGPQAKILAQLGLTEDQKTKIKAIQDKAATDKKAITDNKTLTPDASAAQLKALTQNSRKEVQAVLTTEQKAKMKTLTAEAKKKKDAAAGQPAPGTVVAPVVVPGDKP